MKLFSLRPLMFRPFPLDGAGGAVVPLEAALLSPADGESCLQEDPLLCCCSSPPLRSRGHADLMLVGRFPFRGSRRHSRGARSATVRRSIPTSVLFLPCVPPTLCPPRDFLPPLLLITRAIHSSPSRPTLPPSCGFVTLIWPHGLFLQLKTMQDRHSQVLKQSRDAGNMDMNTKINLLKSNLTLQHQVMPPPCLQP